MHIRRVANRLAVAVSVLGLVLTAAPVVVQASTGTAIAAPLPPGGSFVPVPPVRVLDSRTGHGLVQSVHFDPRASLPRDAATSVAAVLVNVTVVDAAGSGWVALGPWSGTSTGNFVARRASATLALVRYTGDPVEVSVSVPAAVIVDVQGYVTSPEAATSATFSPLETARRIIDTRDGKGLVTFAAGQTQTVAARSLAGVPSDATAVVANVTVASASASTYVTGWSGVGARPTVSTVNATPGDIVANRAVLPVDPSGRVALFNFAGRTDLVVDVVGYLSPDPAGSYYTPAEPVRLLDRREWDATVLTADEGDRDGYRLAPSVWDLAPPTAVWLTLVGDQPVVPGFVTARPADTDPTATSDVNTWPGRAVANSGPVRVNTSNGRIEVTASVDTRLVVDLVGYFRKAPAVPARAGLWYSSMRQEWNAPDRADTRGAGVAEGAVDGVFTANATPHAITLSYAVAPDGTVGRAAYEEDLGWMAAYPVRGLANVRSLATAGDHLGATVYAVTADGGLLGTGSDAHGELGSPPTPDPDGDWPRAESVAIPLPAGATVTTAFAAPGVGYAVLADGRTLSWGRSDTAQLGRPTTTTPWTPAPVVFPTGAPVALAGDGQVTFAVDATGRTLWWGSALLVNGGDTPVLQAVPTLLATGCDRTVSLHSDPDGLWAVCDDGSVVVLAQSGRMVGSHQVLPISRAVQVAAGVGLGHGLRVRLTDGRVADVTAEGARYEAGFERVTAINGSRTVQLTLVR